MKNKTFIFFSLSLSLTLYSYSQTNSCGEDIHGTVNTDMDCNSTILITSTIEDGKEGSKVKGDFSTTDQIIITPGNTSVRIIAYQNDMFRGPFTGRGTRLRSRNRVANGIETRKKNPHDKIITVIFNSVKEEVSIEASTAIVTGYQLSNIHGNILKKAIFKSTKKISFSVLAVKRGIYFLTIQLKTGTVQTRKIIKN